MVSSAFAIFDQTANSGPIKNKRTVVMGHAETKLSPQVGASRAMVLTWDPSKERGCASLPQGEASHPRRLLPGAPSLLISSPFGLEPTSVAQRVTLPHLSWLSCCNCS